MRPVLLLWICAAIPCQSIAAPPLDLKLEYRKNASGIYTAILTNRRNAAVTAYIAEASYNDGARERHSAMGGDTLGFSNGEDAELAPLKDTDIGRPLPRNESATATRVLAAVFADGVTEGEDDVIAMLLSGRHRALADLNESLKMLAQPASADKLLSFFQEMQTRDQEEGARLDDLQDAPGRMRYRYFMSAVPASALQVLQSRGSTAVLLARFQDWRKRLAESKPSVR